MKTIHLCFCICLLLFLAQCKKIEEPTPTYHDFESCLNSDLSQAEGSIQISTTVVNHTAADKNNGTVKIHTNIAFTFWTISYSHPENPVPVTSVASDAIGDITLNGLLAGEYTDVVLTLEDCISKPFSFTIETAEPSNVYINSPNSNICLGESTLITGSSDSEGTKYFAWNTGATTQSISVSPSTTTVYSVTITDVTGSSNSTSLTVTVGSSHVELGPNRSICLGGSITLNPSTNNVASYQWNNGMTTPSIIISPATTTTYTVTVTSPNGCTDTDEMTVTVGNTNVELGENQTICLGETVNIIASSTNAFFYSWNTGETSQSISVFPTQTTTYSVTVTEENACTATDSITIVVENCGN